MRVDAFQPVGLPATQLGAHLPNASSATTMNVKPPLRRKLKVCLDTAKQMVREGFEGGAKKLAQCGRPDKMHLLLCSSYSWAVQAHQCITKGTLRSAEA